jgi:hypothetical protein
MNTWRNLPGKIFVTLASLDPRLRSRSCHATVGLSRDEAELFLSMARYDLAHSLAVSARLEDDPLLHKAGLLHDTGKLRSELGLFVRWLYTALEILYPSRLRILAARIEDEAAGSDAMERVASLRRGWKRGLYVQLHHAEIAGELLAGMGCEEDLVRLVATHQEEPCDKAQRRLKGADDSL